MPTLVAASITPTNRAFINFAWSPRVYRPPINIAALKVPSAIGTSTPTVAIAVAAAPLFFRALISVSRPLENRIKITPISANVSRTSISGFAGFINPLNPIPRLEKIAGPISSPEITMPVT